MSLNSTTLGVNASSITETSIFNTNNDQDPLSTVSTTIGNVIANTTVAVANTTTTRKFYWEIQTVTMAPTIVVGTDYYYYYIWWFYSFLTILFLISLSMLFVKLAQQRRLATARQATALSARQNAATNGCNNGNGSNAGNSAGNPTGNMAEGNMTVLEGVTDLPPAYDDVIQIVNAKMELQAAEEGAVGGMTTAISTSTMETNVDMDGSANDISATSPAVMIASNMLPTYAAYESSVNNDAASNINANFNAYNNHSSSNANF